ncbi:hypothetical protein OQJ26_00680 [Legionella sp. PATHC038]|uniref:hypothetical protein n=1 Tax=Legionella sheltonii TaxID=2992041 RepID=UPI002244CACC|nr:hypothetical protein [Legionella sp. PATHC038]MCW8397308.1 hypothetical protein [Legionella sp. PATHC038]
MKLIKAIRNFTESELLNLVGLILNDALSMNPRAFWDKYHSFEVPEPLIHFKSGSENNTSALCLVLKAISDCRGEPCALANLILCFEFLIESGADINIRIKDDSGKEVTPLSYLVTNQIILGENYFREILDIGKRAKLPIAASTLEKMILYLLLNPYVPDLKKRKLVDLLILNGAEITTEHEVICVSDIFFQEYKYRWRCMVLERKHEKLQQQVEGYELNVQRLEQQNNLLTEQLAQLTQKIDSLIKSSEKVDTNPAPTWHSFFGL